MYKGPSWILVDPPLLVFNFLQTSIHTQLVTADLPQFPLKTMWSLQNSPSPPFPPSQVINDDWSLTHTLEPSNTFLLLRSRSWFTLWLSRKSNTPRCLSLTARQIGTSSAWRKIDTKMLDIDASNYRHRSAVHHKCKSTVVVSKTVSNKFQRKRVVNTRLEKSKPLYGPWGQRLTPVSLAWSG